MKCSRKSFILNKRARVPRWLFNKKICFSLAALSRAFAVGKFAYCL
jgi:hypothetical protein